MSDSATNEKDCRQDSWERLDKLLDVLEKRVYALLDRNDPELMKPVEIERAILGYVGYVLRFLELRLKYGESSDMNNQQALVDAYLASEVVDMSSDGYGWVKPPHPGKED